MTRTQSPFDRPLSAKALAGLSTPPGSRTVKAEPLPGSLATITSPPIMRASLRVMARPSPVPPNRWAVVASAWVNSSNSFACFSGVTALLVSATDSSIQWPPLLILLARSLTSPSLVKQSLDHLVGQREQRRRHVEAEGF